MDFVAVVDQVIALLRQRSRVTYRTLKRQSALDDAALEDLKVELIEDQLLATDEQGTVLVWTGAATMSSPPGDPTPTPACTPVPVKGLVAPGREHGAPRSPGVEQAEDYYRQALALAAAQAQAG